METKERIATETYNFKKWCFDNNKTYLLDEWLYTKNSIKPEEITPFSNKSIWWKCLECGYEYQSKTNARIHGSGCACCGSKVLVIGVNDLETKRPDLVKQWNYEKNKPSTPSEVICGGTKKYWWLCQKCGYEWLSSIDNRKKHGCPVCTHQKVLPGYNDFATINPKAASEWDYDKNGDIKPNMVASNSDKKYWFKCIKGHEWFASPGTRKRNNCPYCGNQRLLPGYNDLEHLNPKLAKEWNYERNEGLLPSQVMEYSNRKVWWECPTCGHEWKTSVSCRSSGTGCPKCKNDYKVSESERIIYYYVRKYFNDALISYKPKWLNRKEIDIYIPSLKLAIEYDGEIWHRDVKKDEEKTQIINSKGITLIRFREEKCLDINDSSYKIKVPSINYKYSRLNKPVQELFDYINTMYGLNIKPIINVDEDAEEILSLTAIDKKEKSLLVVKPDIAKQWNYEKNKLRPENVLPSSNKIVWWKCEKGHEWKSSISNRKDRGCPVCGKKRIISGVNDLATLSPSFFSEWDYSKNNVDPTKIGLGDHKQVWWKCSTCGHEWKVSVGNRFYGTNCPICAIRKRSETTSKKRAISGKNDLATVWPELLKYWDYENNNRKPFEVSFGSEKKYWWRDNNCGHSWQDTINSMHLRNGKCPYCNNVRYLQGVNDFETKCPERVKDWNYEKNNGLKPSDIIVNSRKTVFWKCHICGHEWKQQVFLCASKQCCPECGRKAGLENKRKNILKKQGSFADNYPELLKEWNYERNTNIDPNNVVAGTPLKVWWKCSKCDCEWKTAIRKRTRENTGCPNCKETRPYRKYDKNQFLDLLNKYDKKEINLATFAKQIGVSTPTISNMVKKYNEGNYRNVGNEIFISEIKKD